MWAGGSKHQARRNVQRFRGGLVFKAHRLCVSLNSRLKSNKEEAKVPGESGLSRTSEYLRARPAPGTAHQTSVKTMMASIRTVVERRGNNCERCNNFYLQVQARIWP